MPSVVEKVGAVVTVTEDLANFAETIWMEKGFVFECLSTGCDSVEYRFPNKVRAKAAIKMVSETVLAAMVILPDKVVG